MNRMREQTTIDKGNSTQILLVLDMYVMLCNILNKDMHIVMKETFGTYQKQAK